MSILMKQIALCGVVFGVVPSSDLHAHWSTDALSLARQTTAAVSVDGKVLFAGGRTGGTLQSVVDIYDEASGTWAQTALSEGRTNLAAAAVGHYALFAGGNPLISTSSAVVDILDVQTMTWSSTTLSQARNSLAATRVGKKVIFSGGATGGLFNPVASDVVDIYDSELGIPSNPAAWSTTTLSVARAGLAATTVGHRALFAGGILTAGTASATVDIYDDSTGGWSTSTLSQARAKPAAASTGARACFGGGSINSSLFSDVVDIFDADSGTWTSHTLSSARGLLSAVALGDTVLFAGGFTNTGTASDVVDVLDASKEAWGPAMQLSLGRGDTPIDANEIDLLVLDEALDRLAALDPRQARIVELRFFTGLTVDEVAEVLAVSPRTVASEWRLTRAWLSRELEGGGAPRGAPPEP